MSVLEHTPLGKTVSYESIYNKGLLQGVPRSLNRNPLGIKKSQLPFKGEDLWNLYEISWLNPNGKPVVATAEVRFSIDSINLIESKSFKLYLNSFNQTHFNNEQEVISVMKRDLSDVAEGSVSITLNPESLNKIQALDAVCIDSEQVTIEHYDIFPDYLADTALPSNIISESLCSHLLKSNCLVTGQPDWASVQITYSGPQINRANLLKYLISFRQHNEFHEQCVERIFIDIKRYCKPESLTVFARYTRRGGLDINPLRSDNVTRLNNHRLVRQ